MFRERFAENIRVATQALQREGVWPAGTLPPFQVEIPADAGHGDLASNAAMVLARPLKRVPHELAEEILNHLPEDPWFQAIEVAGPGFLNARLAPAAVRDAVLRVEAEGDAYGRAPATNERILLEFVSANPTGPMNVVSARAAAFGDALGNLLEAAGHTVAREYYVNDAGAQIAALGKSLEARIREIEGEPFEFPPNGYAGDYVKDLAEAWLAADGPGVLEKDEAERTQILADYAVSSILRSVKADLAAYGVHYDRFYSERHDLREKGRVEEVIDFLGKNGRLYEKEGALWLRTTDAGDDKDRVVRRADGTPTYFAPDIAYHKDKYDRGFTTLIDVLGPDHHGYVARLRAAVEALGYDPGSFEAKIVQHIRLLRMGEAVSMSKRHGEIIPMSEFLSEVGKDAARFFFLLRSADTPLDFDLDLAVKESSDNPVYYVQYAHARISSILRQAGGRPDDGDLTRLTEPEETGLIRRILAYPEEILMAAELREPHHIARFALDLAGAFHSFYTRHRVLGVEADVSKARLRLVWAVAQTLRSALRILGVSAPESM